jgi:hypothetical protein
MVLSKYLKDIGSIIELFKNFTKDNQDILSKVDDENIDNQTNRSGLNGSDYDNGKMIATLLAQMTKM